MIRKLFTVAALGIVTSAGLLATGCASDNKSSNQPYSVTGTQDHRMDTRYQDSKGRYHPEWVPDNAK